MGGWKLLIPCCKDTTEFLNNEKTMLHYLQYGVNRGIR